MNVRVVAPLPLPFLVVGLALYHHLQPGTVPTPPSTGTALSLRTRVPPAYQSTQSRSRGVVKVLGIWTDNSSVKISYASVPGAKDYRVYDVKNPSLVKYAGLVHLTAPNNAHFVMRANGKTPVYPYRVTTAGVGPQTLETPADTIEWNSMEDGRPHTLVVQALDRLGPAPLANLYDANNLPIVRSSAMSGSHASSMTGLGLNQGTTLDGRVSINGQGPYINEPRVLASSRPFVVQARPGYKPIPSTGTAAQTFLDTFKDGEEGSLKRIARDPQADSMSYRLNAGTPRAATVQYQYADVQDSVPFIMQGHFMDVLFDGGTPGTGNPLHQGHGVMAYSPDQTEDFSGGRILHFTMEVDAHLDGRRWVSMVLSPASAPLSAFDPNLPVSASNQAVFLQIFQSNCTLNIYTHSDPQGNPTGTAGGTYGSALWGAAGQAATYCVRPENGIALDNRSRFDFFISQTHAALFEDGKLLAQSDIPAGSFPWSDSPVKAYIEHYVYHTDNEVNDLLQYGCGSMQSYWFNDPIHGTATSANACGATYPPGYGFRYSDERHWDNFGMEVLPQSVSPGSGFASLASLVALPREHAPKAVHPHTAPRRP